MRIELVGLWKDDACGFFELRINKSEACCVKYRNDSDLYVLKCYDGNDVYSYIGGAEFPLRKLTKAEENRVLDFVKHVLFNN